MVIMLLYKNVIRFVLCIDLIEKIKMKEFKLKIVVLWGWVDFEYEGKIFINLLD